jgi:formylglycine-generating enzyme required for sulfatase activity
MKHAMKKGVMLLALAVLTAGGLFAQRVGDTVQVSGSSWTVETVSGDRMTLRKAQDAIPGFARIEGGTFTMGSPSNETGRQGNEGPQHQVTVSAFYMGKNLVTQAEYEAVMGTNPSSRKGSNLPVERVSWNEAAEYCNKLSQRERLTPAYQISGNSVTCNWNANGYRLPTEAEWEYACRAGTTTAYNTGSNTISNDTGWYRDNSGNTSHPVGQKPANAWGLFDMHGNMFELCWDRLGNYSSDTQNNPRGPDTGDARVLRGGSFNYAGNDLRSAYRRTSISAVFKNDHIGFRLARGRL